MAMTKKLGIAISQAINAYEVAQLMRTRMLQQMGYTKGAAWEQAADKYAYWDAKVNLTRQALIDMGIPMIAADTPKK